LRPRLSKRRLSSGRRSQGGARPHPREPPDVARALEHGDGHDLGRFGEGAHRLEELLGPREKGICTSMMTTSGESSRASCRALPSFGTSAMTSMPVGGQYPGKALPERVVWSSASSTLIGPLVSASVFGSSPKTHPLRSVGACGKALYRLHDSRPGSSPLGYRERHPHGAPRKFERYSPECA
jgi:hypothetical protein